MTSEASHASECVMMAPLENPVASLVSYWLYETLTRGSLAIR